MYLLTGFFVILQPCHLRVLGSSVRKGRLAVSQGPEEAGSGQPKVAVRSRHSVRRIRRSIRKCVRAGAIVTGSVLRVSDNFCNVSENH